jgi:hypothetical protein
MARARGRGAACRSRTSRVTRVPIARIPFWQLRRHGVVEEAVRGGTRRRIVGRDWPLPDAVREKMRGLLEPLGFDLGRAISVREPDGEEALEFRQDAGGH